MGVIGIGKAGASSRSREELRGGVIPIVGWSGGEITVVPNLEAGGKGGTGITGGTIPIGLIGDIGATDPGNIGVTVGVIVFAISGGTIGGAIGGANEAPTTLDVVKTPGGVPFGTQIKSSVVARGKLA